MKKTDKKEKMLDLSKGDMENDEFIRCRQTLCGYFVNEGCKKCEDCSAPPLVLRKGCKKCIDCSTIPESLRWDDPNAKKEADKNNPEKVLLELMKEAAEERLRQIAAEEKGKKPIENTTPKIEIIIPER
jgi:hypothetical protein